MNIIQKIKRDFIKEAQDSPLLFTDLSSVEGYISESYSGRSLIELLQNADDALSSKFLIKYINKNTFIVANDGREFDEMDLVSLCRSGSSTKKRRQNTIGYRGIGFKSVVNYSKSVHLISGKINCTFSKKLTKEVLKSNNSVPLIRIPHEFNTHEFDNDIKEILNLGYKTIFIFEVNNNNILDEINIFDPNTMIYLNNIQEIYFDDQVINIKANRKKISEKHEQVEVIFNKAISTWLLIKDKDVTSLAFKLLDDKVVSANESESLAHVFMPTEEKLGIPIKVNSDFSTDPSRKKIVSDEYTEEAIKNIGKLLSSEIAKVIEERNDEFGIMNVIKDVKTTDFYIKNQFNISNEIIKTFFDNLKENIARIYDNKRIVIQSINFNSDEFENIADFLGYVGISYKDEEKMPGILELFKKLKFKELENFEVLKSLNTIKLSQSSRVNILSDLIGKSLFMRPNDLDNLLKAPLFKINDKYISIQEIDASSKIDLQYEESIIEKLSTATDYTHFLKRFDISHISNDSVGRKKEKKITDKNIINFNVAEEGTFKSKTPIVKKWRSVEKNLKSCLEQMDNVIEVKDVSKQNLGYDIEVTYSGNKKEFIEVKSVKYIGESFSITNNEYSTANELDENYKIAIVNQSEENLEVCFIDKPIHNLQLEKRATRVEWLCESYSGSIMNFNML